MTQEQTKSVKELAEAHAREVWPVDLIGPPPDDFDAALTALLGASPHERHEMARVNLSWSTAGSLNVR